MNTASAAVRSAPQPVPAKDPKVFDLQTHYWDSQGKCIRKNLYNCFIVQGVKYFERPINSGNLWYENNEPAGRCEVISGVREFFPDRAHREYVPPPTADEQVAQEMAELRSTNEELQRELAAIRGERAAKEATTLEALGDSSDVAEVATGNKVTPTLSKRTPKE